MQNVFQKNLKQIKNQSISDNIFMLIVYVSLIFVLVVCAYPMIYIVSASFSSTKAVASGEMWLFPKDFTLEAYKVVLQNDFLYTGFINSIFYVVMAVLINMVVMMIAGFALSRKELPGRSLISLYMIITMFFGGGLIPTYLVYMQLGLLDTRWALLLPGISISNIIIARTSIQSSIPEELFESAKMDGCGYIRYLIRVVVPLSKAIIAVFSLYTFVGMWNSYMSALIYLQDYDKMPLQVFLRKILVLNSTMDMTTLTDENMIKVKQMYTIMKYAVIVIGTLPVMLIYPFAQKYFVKGVMVGSLKG